MSILSAFRIEPIHAHCDVPCGIYDPHTAALAAKTVHVLATKLADIANSPAGKNPHEQIEKRNSIIRMVTHKEEHAALCKKDLLVLWTDYFKPEHLAMFPNLHDTFWKAAKLCSWAKQHVDPVKSGELVAAVEEIAGMFRKAEERKATVR